MIEASDPTIGCLARRLRDRALFKSIDIRTRVAHVLDPKGLADEERTNAVDKACAEISEKLADWNSHNQKDVPRLFIDEARRSPYTLAQESDGPLGRINIRTADGDVVDLGQRSSVVAALKPFILSRVYVDGEDDEAGSAVTSIIDGHIRP